MSNSYVQRPKANKKKIHSKNEFELCYLRHQYIRKVDYNPTEQDMAPYVPIVKNLAKNTFFTYRNLFHMVGMESEDLINVGKMHLVSFLGLFSLEKMPGKMEDFFHAHIYKHKKTPKEDDYLDKNKANFTMFLKQRMEDVVRVCRQKARNIRGMPTEEFYVYCGEQRPPKISRDLVENYEKYGFRKIDIGTYKSIKKRAKPEGLTFFFNNLWYIAVPVEHKSLSIADFSGADMDPYDNIHNMTPEQVLFHKQEAETFEAQKEEFEQYSDITKLTKVRDFVETHKDNPEFADEIKVARKLLKDMGA
jgi:hypothetical protein